MFISEGNKELTCLRRDQAINTITTHNGNQLSIEICYFNQLVEAQKCNKKTTANMFDIC